MGIHRALPHAEIVGVDIENQPRYPFQFRLANAMSYPLDGFDFIWASPPCQGYSIMRNLPWLRHKEYPLLIAATQDRLLNNQKPFCIENVDGARHEMDANWLCGTMFGLPFFRHRRMQTNFFWLQPGHPAHVGTVRNGRMLGSRARDVVVQNGAQVDGCGYGHAAGIGAVRKAMGIDWMTRDEMSQAVPPAYSEYILRQWRP